MCTASIQLFAGSRDISDTIKYSFVTINSLFYTKAIRT